MRQGLCTPCMEHTEPEKLKQLRAKTDQQLLSIIHAKLELGMTLIALVEETHTDGSGPHIEQLLRRVEQAVTEVKQLLPVLNEDQRRGFCPTLNNVRQALDRLSRNLDRPRSATASMF
jgi:hypothetical protein